MSTSWNFTIDDASPFLQYAPYADGPLSNGWQAWYSDAQNAFNPSCGEAAVGNSEHITSLSGASISLQFYGNAIYLYGSGNSSYQVSLDNAVVNLSPPSGDLLYSEENLSLGTHYVNLTALPSSGQQLLFDKAIITDSLPAGSALPTIVTFDNSNVTAVQYVGNWSSKSDAHVPNASHPVPFHVTTSSESYASFNFTGGIGVAINGSKNCGHGVYTIKLFDSSQQFQTSSSFNASTNWLVGDSLLYYYSGLDPDKSYEVQIDNSAGDGTSLTLNDFTVFQSNVSTTSGTSSDSHHKTNVGVIVGPTIAGVAVLVFLALLVLFLLRRRARQATKRAEGQIIPYSNEITPAPGAAFSSSTLEKGNAALSEPQHNRVIPIDTGTGTQSSASHPAPSTSSQSHSNPPIPIPPPPSQEAPPPPAHPPSVDVNRIIELIASRIDRPVVGGEAMDEISPPRYPQPAEPTPPPPQPQPQPPRYRK